MTRNPRTSSFGKRLYRSIVYIQICAFVLMLILQFSLLVLRNGDSRSLRTLSETYITLDELSYDIVNQETGQRGFDMTANATFLTPYQSGIAAYNTHARQLLALTSSKPVLRGQAQHIVSLGRSWTQFYGSPQITRVQQGKKVTSAELLQGKQVLDRFRSATASLKSTVMQDINNYQADQSTLIHWSQWFDFTLIPAMLLAVLWAVRRQLNGWIRPIRQLSKVVDGYRDGHLQVEATRIADNSELGSLFNGIEAMRLALLRYITTVEKRYDALFHNNPSAVIRLDDGFQITEVNAAAVHLLGYTAAELANIGLVDRIDASFLNQSPSWSRPLEVGTACELTLVHKAGHAVDVELSVVPIVEADKSEGLYLMMTDITEKRAASQRMETMALEDPLTKSANRRRIELEIDQLIQRAKSEANLEFSVLFIDLDGFKVVNDGLGHAVGDDLLRRVAERLSGSLDEGFFGRIGGDEFIMIYPKSRMEAAQLAARILDCAEPFVIEGIEITMTASIGIASFPQDGLNVMQLVQRADSAMYTAKGLGKNTYQFFDPHEDTGMYHKLQTLTDLQSAIAKEEFTLFFQPQIQIDSHRIVGAEALLRWNHPVQGLLTPDKFISTAEESGLIIPIGKWVIREAIASCARWHQAGHTDLTVAVNLSPTQFMRTELPDFIQGTLEAFGLPAHSLIVEITESTMMRFDSAITMMERLKDIGIRVSIDDFGTGYSSLGYLRNYNVDEIKIDQLFIQNMMRSVTDQAIVSTIVALGRAMQLQIVAEGVESEEQRDYLRSLGCDIVQGHLVSQPIASDHFEDFIAPYGAAHAMPLQHRA